MEEGGPRLGITQVSEMQVKVVKKSIQNYFLSGLKISSQNRNIWNVALWHLDIYR